MRSRDSPTQPSRSKRRNKRVTTSRTVPVSNDPQSPRTCLELDVAFERAVELVAAGGIARPDHEAEAEALEIPADEGFREHDLRASSGRKHGTPMASVLEFLVKRHGLDMAQLQGR